jgi:hypothetical protein
MAGFNRLTGSASGDLGIGMSTGVAGGLGDALGQQVGDMTEEEKLRKRLGLSVTQQSGSLAVQSLFGGMSGRNT